MTIHIQEAEAVQDFAKVMEHVRNGDVVRLERDGAATALIQQPETSAHDVRHVEDVIARLQKSERHPALRIPDPTFAEDIQAAHDSINRPLDTSKWD